MNNKTLEHLNIYNRYSYIYLLITLIFNSIFNGEFTLVLITLFTFVSIIRNRFVIHKYTFKFIAAHIVILLISIFMISENIQDTSIRDIFRDIFYILDH